MAKSQFYKDKNRIESVNEDKPSLDQVRYILSAAKGLFIPDLPDAAIVRAFYMCKQTVVHENDVGNYEYTFLNWSEFQEFIGRLAQQKYLKTNQNTQWPLDKKIEVVLNYLF